MTSEKESEKADYARSSGITTTLLCTNTTKAEGRRAFEPSNSKRSQTRSIDSEGSWLKRHLVVRAVTDGQCAASLTQKTWRGNAHKPCDIDRAE